MSVLLPHDFAFLKPIVRHHRLDHASKRL